MVIVYKLVATSILAILNTTGHGDPSKVKPIAVLQGHDTLIEYPMVRMIQDQKTWGQLWTLHKGISGIPGASGGIVNADSSPTPVVDFGENEVLIVFGGHNANVQAYDYVKTDVRGKTAVIQITPSMFGTAALEVDMTPYIIMVLPREKVEISVELDTVARDGSHSWNQIAKFAAPKTAPKK